jgi:LacI family transcriptional regulator
MASIDDVARRAGVSPITVSRVVRGHPHVRDETRRRVLEAVSDLHYVPNAIARGLKQSRSELIALIVTDMVDPFFSVVTHGVEDAVRRAGMVLVLGNSADEFSLEVEYLRIMEEHRVAGIILVPTPRMPGVSLPALPRQTPLVILDRSLPGVDADVVRCDTASGTRALCAHLIDLGRRRIAIVGGADHTLTWQERVGGFQSALLDAGLTVPADFIISGNYKADSGTAAVRALMAGTERPDAIIAANGKVVRGVLDELITLGYRIPEDVAVAAIDDPFPDSTFWPRLTVVEQPGYEMGQVAVELLTSRLSPVSSNAPWREIVFDSVLRPGATCGERVATPNISGVRSAESRGSYDLAVI